MLLPALVVLAVAGGLAVRVAMVRSSWGVLESDEAVVGLMARSILDGDLPTFFWGQRYGGTAEAFVLAGVFGIAGSSTLAIRVVSVSLSAAAAVLVWRVGRRVGSPVQAAAAGLAFWSWPLASVFWSIKSRGFYWATIVGGLAFVLAVLRLAERPDRTGDAMIAGLAAGVGWWSSPQITVFVVPAVAWALVRARPAIRPLLTRGLPCAVVGAGPWLAFNVRHAFVSLDPPEVRPGAAGSYLDHLETFASRGLPMALGLRLPFTEDWVPGGRVVYLAAAAALVTALAVRRPAVLPAALVAFPLIHALSPLSHHVGEGRYLVYLAPILALAVTAAVTRRRALVVLVACLGALTVYGAVTVGTAPMPYASDRPVPERVDDLVDDLSRRGLTAAYADYWIAYRVVFESGEDVVVGTVPPAVSRRPAYDRRVARSPRAAYLSVAGSSAMHRYRTQLTRLGVAWEEHEAGGFSVIVPDRPVAPAELLEL